MRYTFAFVVNVYKCKIGLIKLRTVCVCFPNHNGIPFTLFERSNVSHMSRGHIICNKNLYICFVFIVVTNFDLLVLAIDNVTTSQGQWLIRETEVDSTESLKIQSIEESILVLPGIYPRIKSFNWTKYTASVISMEKTPFNTNTSIPLKNS